MQENIICVYMINNLINNKKYIGATKQYNYRIKQHKRELKNNKHRNELLQDEWNIFGEENFEFSIIEKCDIDSLGYLEVKWIIFYKSTEHGYNKTIGGEKYVNDKSKIENIKKMDNSIMSHNSEYLRNKKSMITKSFGFIRGENPKSKKVVCLNTGECFDCIMDASDKYNISYSAIINCCTGKTSYSGKIGNEKLVWMYHKDYIQRDEKEIEDIVVYVNSKTRKLRARPVVCINTNERFSSAKEAAIKYNTDNSSIIKCCKGKLNYSGKLNGEPLKWKYA